VLRPIARRLVTAAAPLITYTPTRRYTEVLLLQHCAANALSPFAGQPDDFVVLRDLCVGATGRLVPGGSLYIVAQAQIPVGAFLRMAKPKYARVQVNITSDNRFVIWKAVAK
jgi:hypothetical protein